VLVGALEHDRQVMLARVRGALREHASLPSAVVRGRLAVDAAHGEARLGDRVLKLERRPLLMLQLLASRDGEVVARSELLERIWGSTYSGFEHSLEQAIHQIRRELREPGWIETVRGIGYKLIIQV
jgi:DNA-binding response OmpR family regulator